METYLNNPDFYYREGEGGQFWLFGHNHMMFDLGFNCDLSDDEAISTAIEIVDKTYDLVMILEHLEESIILFKHALCLPSYTDVVYLATNARSDKQTVAEDYALKIKSWNKADTALYDYFNKTLWKKVEIFGHENMAREKALLRSTIAQVVEECFLGQTDDAGAAKQHGQERPSHGAKIVSYILRQEKVDNELCRDLVRPELKFAAKILKKQYPDWSSFY